MTNKWIPRILFAAPSSGSGKTTVTCGILKAMEKRKLKAVSFKCGPDYIDPMFHTSVCGTKARNLDTFFTDENTTRYLLAKGSEGAEIAVLEGVMGYYDGLAGKSCKASTYDVARVTETPVVLVVNAKGFSVSLAAILKGMMTYQEDANIVGIILNQISKDYYAEMKALLEAELLIPVLGYIPFLENFQLESRHLGLLLPEEVENLQEKLEEVADILEGTIEIDRLLQIAATAPTITYRKPRLPHLKQKAKIAVARDEAFQFYYAENLELLEEMGAELIFFSPIREKKLPEEITGLLLGGGYPERFAKELAANTAMRACIAQALEQGLPCLAECGGFLYLQEELEGTDGSFYPMVGTFPGKAYRTQKLQRFGYVELEADRQSALGERGQEIKGHEFHYWDCDTKGDAFIARKPLRNKSYACICVKQQLVAGFPHLYYYSNPDMLYAFCNRKSHPAAPRTRREEASIQAKKRFDSIAKPLGSLGKLEQAIIKIAGIRENAEDISIDKKALLILCADHGVVAEGVTQTDYAVTKIVSENFAKGKSCVNYMSEIAGATVYTVDIGMNTENYPTKELIPHTVVDRKIAKGSGNIAIEAAMKEAQCLAAVDAGIQLVKELKEKGIEIIATGEMGIGNTTPTSALAAAFFGAGAEAVTGKGAGLPKEGIRHKTEIVAQAIKRVEKTYGIPCKSIEPYTLLAELGGYEIAGMAGVFLGGVLHKIPIVIDGAISAVAAAVAGKIDRRVAEYAIASHESAEITGKLALQELGLQPMLTCEMCLGEGTGAVAALPLLSMGASVYNHMSTFCENQIEPYENYEEAK